MMLQQTRVDTVIDYYQRFLKKFPTIRELANASQQDILKQWQGLGYYRRAKLIHKTAKKIVTHFDAKFPRTRDELSLLPGFGPYTSGAVASIAFGEPVPAVDGNVRRVLSRIFETNESIDSIAQQAVYVDSPSDWTQALMELGALVCSPKNAKCLTCPTRDICGAHLSGTVEQYPPATKKINLRKIFATTWMIQNVKTKKILIQQRPEDGRWPNMWEFPTDEFEQKPTNPVCSITKCKGENLGRFKHLLTHRAMHIEVVHAQAHQNLAINKHQKWVTTKELSHFPFSKMQMRAFEIYQSKIKVL